MVSPFDTVARWSWRTVCGPWWAGPGATPHSRVPRCRILQTLGSSPAAWPPRGETPRMGVSAAAARYGQLQPEPTDRADRRASYACRPPAHAARRQLIRAVRRLGDLAAF